VDGQRSRRPVEGTLLGGCLSVLTGLIGTPYAPSSWEGSILFIEDINENPGRLMRFWTQWAQSGALAGLRALVVGQLAGVSDRDEVLSQFVRRSAVPVYSCELFGHQAPSFALGQGARARISDSELQWEIDRF
jgi:muramoyltetrapeptide carboxypeptidase